MQVIILGIIELIIRFSTKNNPGVFILFKKFLLICLLLVVFVSCSDKQLSKLKNGDDVRLKGRLTMLGNAPFHYMGLIVDPSYQVSLVFRTEADKEAAQKLLGKNIKLEGELSIKDIQTADGKNSLKLYKVIVTSFE